jgi:hypothetical protein
VARILLLACLAALFPLMLAAVVVMLTRPRPKRLMLSLLIGGWAMSVTSGLLVLHAFEGSDSKVLGSSEAVHPGAYLLGGVLCLAVAYLMGTARGAALRARRAATRPATPAKEGPSSGAAVDRQAQAGHRGLRPRHGAGLWADRGSRRDRHASAVLLVDVARAPRPHRPSTSSSHASIAAAR